MAVSQQNRAEKPVAVGSEAIERPVANLLRAIGSVGQTGEPYVITHTDMRDLGLFDAVEVRGWTMVVVSRAFKAVLEHHGCYCSGPYLGHPEVGADDYYLVDRKKAA
jgi:hypothetical protein